MKKFPKLLAALLAVMLLVACADDSADSEEKLLSKTGVPEEVEETAPIIEAVPDVVEEEPIPEEPEEEDPAGFVPQPLDSHVTRALTSRAMREFEAEHAVTTEQERYLAFGAYVLTNNRESIRVFAMGDSGNQAAMILRDFWGVEDRESAMTQLEQLSTANGQSPVADDIYRTLVLTDSFEHLDGVTMYLLGIEPRGLDNVFSSAERRVERMELELESMMELLEADEEDREEIFQLLVYMQATERINNGLDAYIGAKEMLINFLGFTEEELLDLPTLAAWDYGRVAIIARYGVAAGYLQEDVAWEYLQAAAENAAEIYTCWRQYTAAHILGRALAFGNDSDDFRHSLNFLLYHPESSFQTINFK